MDLISTSAGGIEPASNLVRKHMTGNQAMLEASMADRAKADVAITPTISCGHTACRCHAVYEAMEFSVTADHLPDVRFCRSAATDSNRWPVWPTSLISDWMGYSIGPLGRQPRQRPIRHARSVETAVQGPAHFDGIGIPLHADNQTVVKEPHCA